MSTKPLVINITKEEYHADNKNWSIGQDERGVMYFGNDKGLLEFDGVEWHLNKLPNLLIVRSVAVQSHQTIFTGSYEEFGRWDRDISGKLVYTSLSDKLDNAIFKNDDFWKIWLADGLVYFQSFNSIYVYDFSTIKRVPSNTGFLFLLKVRDELLVQQMLGPLYHLKDLTLTKIIGSEIFQNTDVRVLLPFGQNKFLIGTSTKGVFIYDEKTKSISEWNTALSSLMIQNELNCGLLSSKGTYYLGTILNGIYEIDAKGQVVDHISNQSALQNNTVLSLYEDQQHNVWAALDKGISYIKYKDNLSTYADYEGKIGAVYGAALWNDKLFIGTNQGVFYLSQEELTKPNPLANIKFINGTQGQVWELKVVDNQLYCAHNKGLKQIRNDFSVIDAFDIGTGVYNISEYEIKGRRLLLLSTYQSLQIIDPASGMVYKPGQISEPIVNATVDHLGNIWLEHFNRGIYRCKLDDNLTGFQAFSYYGGSNKDNLPYKLKMFKVGGRMVLLGDGRFYTYDDIANRIVDNTVLNECFKNILNLKQVVKISDNLFWAITSSSIYKFSYDGYQASILERYSLDGGLSLIDNYETISVISDSVSLICLDNGFLLYNAIKSVEEYKPNKPYIESLETKNLKGESNFEDLKEYAEVSYDYNTIEFRFSTNNTFASNLSFQYKLIGIDQDWSEPQKINNVSYARLPEGKYVFMVRTVDNLGNNSKVASYEFEVSPPFYQSIWAYLIYSLSFILILYLVWASILKRYQNIQIQKIRIREARRLTILTGELQNEVDQKNAELLTQTSFIIQKNELILRVKGIVDDFHTTSKTNTLAPLYQKINALLNNNMNSEDDWKMFLIKFEEKHTGFFKKMKSLYPQLTNSDLRLCACLKLNLETKEIASLMNLSIRAVENSRYRLRKKLNLQPSQNLNDFLLDID